MQGKEHERRRTDSRTLELVARKSLKYLYRSRPQVHAAFHHLWQIMHFIYCVRGTRTQPLICVGYVHYWVSCAINKGDFFEIAFVVVVGTHLPRFEALAYVLPHFDELTHVVIRASRRSSFKRLLRSFVLSS